MTCEKHTTRNIHPSKLLTFTPTMRSMYKMKIQVVERGQGGGGGVGMAAAMGEGAEGRCGIW